MKTLIWLDDCRDPMEDDWLVFSPIGKVDLFVSWIKNYNDFIQFITMYGLPDAICFDHDLGDDVARENVIEGMSKKDARKLKKEEKTGMDCAWWLVNYCLDKDLDLPKWNIQSANPVGKENIKKLLENYETNRNR